VVQYQVAPFKTVWASCGFTTQHGLCTGPGVRRPRAGQQRSSCKLGRTLPCGSFKHPKQLNKAASENLRKLLASESTYHRRFQLIQSRKYQWVCSQPTVLRERTCLLERTTRCACLWGSLLRTPWVNIGLCKVPSH
jgi:hypothetical protein